MVLILKKIPKVSDGKATVHNVFFVNFPVSCLLAQRTVISMLIMYTFMVDVLLTALRDRGVSRDNRSSLHIKSLRLFRIISQLMSAIFHCMVLSYNQGTFFLVSQVM